MSNQQKLKIAVQVFGHLRTYKECLPYLQRHLAAHYDCDFFIHTWSLLDHNTKTWHDNRRQAGAVSLDRLETELAQMLGAVGGVAVEEQHPQDLGEIITQQRLNVRQRTMSIYGISAMLHSMRESNRLREEYARKNQTRYDFVICLRPDILLKKPLDIARIIDGLSAGQLDRAFFTVANPLFAAVSGFKEYGATDVLFFAAPPVMSAVLSGTEKITAQFHDKMVIDCGPEYFFINSGQEMGFLPYIINNMQYGADFEILRPAVTEKKIRKRIVKMRTRANLFRLQWFPMMLRQVMRWELSLFGFKIDLCCGNINEKV
ncbi:hypothetical protein FACS1894108_12260 [Planctomycetales bacterium]|nr:hypothetical protein FACS1894108_12260 [Planctomycetales bacterium]